MLPTRVSFSFDLQGASLRRATRKKADPARGRPVGGDGNGRGIAPPQWLAEGGDLDGDHLDTIVYSSGTEDAPQTLTLVETDTMPYNCAAARTQNGGTNVRLMNPRARRVH